MLFNYRKFFTELAVAALLAEVTMSVAMAEEDDDERGQANMCPPSPMPSGRTNAGPATSPIRRVCFPPNHGAR